MVLLGNHHDFIFLTAPWRQCKDWANVFKSPGQYKDHHVFSALVGLPLLLFFIQYSKAKGLLNLNLNKVIATF